MRHAVITMPLMLCSLFYAAHLSTLTFALNEFKLSTEVFIDPGQSRSWTFHVRKAQPEQVSASELPHVLVLPRDHRLLLDMEARLHSQRLAGSTTAMLIRINGATMDAGQLVNKPPTFQTRNGMLLTWYGTASWRVLYSPDFHAAERQVTNPYHVIGSPAYRFTFDITELVKDGRNVLTIQHTIRTIANRLILRDVRLRVSRVSKVKRPRAQPLPKYVPAHPKPFAYKVQWLNGGAMRITIAGESFTVTSQFSVPGGGWHELTSEPIATDEDWRIRWMQQTQRSASLSAKCKYYSLQRQVKCSSEWIDVTDVLTNLTDEDMGLHLRHAIKGDATRPQRLYLCGLPSIFAKRFVRGRGNVTTLLVGVHSMVGILPLDDVFRIHCWNFYENETAGIGDIELVLKSRGTITLRWRLHPLERPQPINWEPDADYWAFINSVRRGLNVNFTIRGPFAFLSSVMMRWSDDELKRWLDLRQPFYVSGTIGRKPDGRYAHGTAYITAKQDHEHWRRLFERVRRLHPGIKCLMYFHSFISTEDNAEHKYEDSKLINRAGHHVKYPHRTYLPLFYPTLRNAYGRTIVRYFDVVFDALNADGIYWDEMAYSATLWTYDCWDGVSADIDERTFTIVRRKAAIPLLCQPWKVKQVKQLLNEKRALVANGPPRTETMSKFHFARFRETGALANIVDNHLYTPIGLGDHLTQHTEQDVVDQIRRNLDYGALYYYYAATVPQTHRNLTEKMFPFTPIELHHGVLIGKERILTNRSGIFGWGERTHVRVYVYDAQGKLTDLPVDIYERNGSTLVKLRLPPRYVAAIVRE